MKDFCKLTCGYFGFFIISLILFYYLNNNYKRQKKKFSKHLVIGPGARKNLSIIETFRYTAYVLIIPVKKHETSRISQTKIIQKVF